MANVLTYKDNTFNIGDTITIDYKIKEGEKEALLKAEIVKNKKFQDIEVYSIVKKFDNN
jgi:ribosomal protein L19